MLKRKSISYTLLLTIIALTMIFLNYRFNNLRHTNNFTPLTLDSIKVMDENRLAVKISYLTSKKDSVIQKMIYSELIGKESKEQPTLQSLKRSADDFVTENKKFKAEFPDAAGTEWELKQKQEVIFNTPKLLSILTHHSGYTGGAHGYFTTTSLNYSPLEKKSLELSDILLDSAKFMDKLTIKLRKEYNLGDSDSLNTILFQNQINQLPKVWSYSGDSLISIYNQYEIAPYSTGQIVLKIDKKELIRIIKVDF